VLEDVALGGTVLEGVVVEGELPGRLVVLDADEPGEPEPDVTGAVVVVTAPKGAEPEEPEENVVVAVLAGLRAVEGVELLDEPVLALLSGVEVVENPPGAEAVRSDGVEVVVKLLEPDEDRPEGVPPAEVLPTELPAVVDGSELWLRLLNPVPVAPEEIEPVDEEPLRPEVPAFEPVDVRESPVVEPPVELDGAEALEAAPVAAEPVELWLRLLDPAPVEALCPELPVDAPPMLEVPWLEDPEP
jgi:hypothetical protein